MLSRHVSLIPKPVALSQTLLGFSPNDHIFAKNWDMWSDRPEYLKFRVSWNLDSGCTTLLRLARVLHSSVSTGLELLAPVFLCLPGLIAGKLEQAQSPYSSSPVTRMSVPACG